LKFILEEVGPASEQGAKIPFSSSLPEEQIHLLATSAKRLNRGKAVVVRTAIHSLFELDPGNLEQMLMTYYRAPSQGSPKPFTTSLTVSLKERIGSLADKLHRNKTDLIRAALHHFLLLSPEDQDRAVRRYLSL